MIHLALQVAAFIFLAAVGFLALAMVVLILSLVLLWFTRATMKIGPVQSAVAKYIEWAITRKVNN
jgi:hypothetical protein